MKITDFRRDELNNVIAICTDGKKSVEVALTSEYVAANKPQVGDELVVAKEEADPVIAQEIESTPE